VALEHAAIAHRTPLMRQSTRMVTRLLCPRPRRRAPAVVIVAFESLRLFLDKGLVRGFVCEQRACQRQRFAPRGPIALTASAEGRFLP
jgi:hypothetical protein